MPESESGKGNRDGQNVSLVHDRLRTAILMGDIPAGETSQVALAKELDVGRTPLREALRLLQREGLVISEPNRRVQVAPLSCVDAEELYIMRMSLEAAAVRITVPMLGTEGVAELEGLMAQMDHYMRTRDSLGVRVPHREFHGRLVGGAGERVVTLVSLLFDHAERYRIAAGATSASAWQARRSEHRAILDAAGDGDAGLAAQRLVEHYAHTVAMIFEGLDDGYQPVRLRTIIDSLAPGVAAKTLPT